jgi:hypothetical protein
MGDDAALTITGMAVSPACASILARMASKPARNGIPAAKRQKFGVKSRKFFQFPPITKSFT